MNLCSSECCLTLMCPVLGGGCNRGLYCNTGNCRVKAYIPDSTKCLPVTVSVIDSGPEKLECSRGGADFRNRLGGFVAWKLCLTSIWIVWNNAGSVPGNFNVHWSIGCYLCLLVEYPKCALCNPSPGSLHMLRNCITISLLQRSKNPTSKG